MAALCLAGALLNIALTRLCIRTGIPLYMDTVLTVTLTLGGGLFWGALCGVFTNLIYQTIWFWGWEGYLFTLCSIATALITWLFIRIFPQELDFSTRHAKREQMIHTLGIERGSGKLVKVMDRVIVLFLLSFALCIAMSILGGLLTAVILGLNPSLEGQRGLTVILRDIMFGKDNPVLLVEISSRIPINIIDRLIAVFGGYGIAVGLKLLSKTGNAKRAGRRFAAS